MVPGTDLPGTFQKMCLSCAHAHKTTSFYLSLLIAQSLVNHTTFFHLNWHFTDSHGGGHRFKSCSDHHELTQVIGCFPGGLFCFFSRIQVSPIGRFTLRCPTGMTRMPPASSFGRKTPTCTPKRSFQDETINSTNIITC